MIIINKRASAPPPAVIALIASGNMNGGLNGPFTSSAFDSTGANFLAIAVSSIAAGSGGGATTVTDNKSNTWSAATFKEQGQVRTRLHYVQNATVGTGHTITVSGSVIAIRATFAAFSNVALSSALESQNQGSASSTTTVQPGSVTPVGNGRLILCTIGNDGSASSASIDSGFTKIGWQAFSSGNNEGGGLAYLVQSVAGAINPTWTLNSSVAALAATSVVFTP